MRAGRNEEASRVKIATARTAAPRTRPPRAKLRVFRPCHRKLGGQAAGRSGEHCTEFPGGQATSGLAGVGEAGGRGAGSPPRHWHRCRTRRLRRASGSAGLFLASASFEAFSRSELLPYHAHARRTASSSGEAHQKYESRPVQLTINGRSILHAKGISGRAGLRPSRDCRR
jgi:hypothetical protein